MKNLHTLINLCLGTLIAMGTFMIFPSASQAGSAPKVPKGMINYRNAPPFPIEKLKNGGYVVFFRHAQRSKFPIHGKLLELDLRGACQEGTELNVEGNEQARTIAAKIKDLGIPVGELHASPSCRTRQMAQIMVGEEFEINEALSPSWVRTRSRETHRRLNQALSELMSRPVEKGNNRFLLSHGNILNPGLVGLHIVLGQAEAAIFRPNEAQNKDKKQNFDFMGIISKAQWVAE